MVLLTPQVTLCTGLFLDSTVSGKSVQHPVHLTGILKTSVYFTAEEEGGSAGVLFFHVNQVPRDPEIAMNFTGGVWVADYSDGKAILFVNVDTEGLTDYIPIRPRNICSLEGLNQGVVREKSRSCGD